VAPLPELEEALVFVMADEGLPALAHDLPVIGLLDDDPAAGFGALVPLGAQILDVSEAWPAGRSRLSGSLGLLDRRDPAGLPRQGADTLEGQCGLLLLPRLALRLHGLPLGRLNALLATR
jgi:hypothetical protein